VGRVIRSKAEGQWRAFHRQVTKLSDRGLVESAGVVTDVGSFLNLVAQRLRGAEELTSARAELGTTTKAA
jgi:hypothetical protein